MAFYKVTMAIMKPFFLIQIIPFSYKYLILCPLTVYELAKLESYQNNNEKSPPPPCPVLKGNSRYIPGAAQGN